MKIILSRKGFDSGNGKIPSPIMPDGTLLSFPIPSKDGSTTYHDIVYQEKPYYQIMQELNPAAAEQLKNSECHVDPDLEYRYKKLSYDWKPAFGQMGIAEQHLKKWEVQEGDVFLFFGWFKQTEADHEGKLHYIKGAKDIHAIYGYMEIGEKITETQTMHSRYPYHPHTQYKNTEHNALYIPSERLTMLPERNGYGLLKFSAERCLTAENADKRRIWALPDCFRNIEISYHTGEKTGFTDTASNHFRSSVQGQEFVCRCDGNKEVMEWLKKVLTV